jgi:hypothetical protein
MHLVPHAKIIAISILKTECGGENFTVEHQNYRPKLF